MLLLDTSGSCWSVICWCNGCVARGTIDVRVKTCIVGLYVSIVGCVYIVVIVTAGQLVGVAFGIVVFGFISNVVVEALVLSVLEGLLLFPARGVICLIVCRAVSIVSRSAIVIG